MLSRMFTGTTGRVFMLLCVMYFFTYVDRVNLSVAAPIIQKEMSLTNTQLGTALSAFGLCYVLLQIINGAQQEGLNLRTVHPITLLAEAYRQ